MANSKTTKDKTSYTEELKKRVDDYSLEYRQYDSNPQLSSPNYGEAQSDNIGCARPLCEYTFASSGVNINNFFNIFKTFL